MSTTISSLGHIWVQLILSKLTLTCHQHGKLSVDWIWDMILGRSCNPPLTILKKKEAFYQFTLQYLELRTSGDTDFKHYRYDVLLY